jgi:hypothetical protein
MPPKKTVPVVDTVTRNLLAQTVLPQLVNHFDLASCKNQQERDNYYKKISNQALQIANTFFLCEQIFLAEGNDQETGTGAADNQE